MRKHARNACVLFCIWNVPAFYINNTQKGLCKARVAFVSEKHYSMSALYSILLEELIVHSYKKKGL